MDENKWNNWKWQLANSLRSMDDLKKYITLTDSECEALQNVGEFAFSIPPFMAERLRESDENSPLRIQFIPNHRECSVHFTCVRVHLNQFLICFINMKIELQY